MVKHKGSISVDELLAQLEKDEEYVRRDTEKSIQRQIETSESVLIEKQILRDLAPLIQRPVSSLADLGRHYAPLSREVVTMLLARLSQVNQNEAIQEALVRCLAAAGVEFNRELLTDLFEKNACESLRWAIANTITEARATGISEWIISAVQDPAYGDARQMLCLALARLIPQRRANEVLISVFDQLPGHVAMGLAESGDLRELEVLRKKRNKYRGWIRKEIDKAVRSISRRRGLVTDATDSVS
jgi:hypothetical protein